jgi:anaerobic magnesium-protoporphyrin IX monomethyl ester cyclase
LAEKNRILLIQPPSPRINFTIPLGLAYLAAVIKNKGWQIKVIDATAPYSHYGSKGVLKEVDKFNPQVVGLTVNTLFCGFAYDLIRELKKKKVVVFAGGPHATLLPEEVLKQGADIAIRGEGEETVTELMEYFAGRQGLEGIKGISFLREDKVIINNPARPLIEDLDTLPFPAKEVFDVSAYARNDFELWRYAGMITSRGCIGRCNFCCREVFANKYRTRGIENVLAEINYLHQTHGLETFNFLDDIFTADMKRGHLFCEAVRERLNFDFSFNCITRFDRVDRPLLIKMKEAGCASINYGVESANPATLLRLNKTETIEEMVEKIHLTKEAGIDCSINFMWGYPWETAEEMQNTASLMRRLSKEVSEIMPGGILIPFPGTELYEEHKQKYNLENWWQDRKGFTGEYRLKSRVVLFRHYLFDDQGQFEGGGFFNISKEIMNRIKSAAGFIGRFNLSRKQNRLSALCLFLTCKFSRILYFINHEAGYIFSGFILWVIGLKKHLGRKLLINGRKTL